MQLIDRSMPIPTWMWLHKIMTVHSLGFHERMQGASSFAILPCPEDAQKLEGKE